MAELADALDLGSSGLPVQVQVLSSAPQEGSLRVANKKSEKRLTLFHCSVLLRLSFFCIEKDSLK